MWFEAAILTAALSATPSADDPLARQAERFALLVGSTVGGPGQTDLAFAERDAERIRGVLTGIGGFSEDRVVRLLRPTAGSIRRALREATERVAASRKRGMDTIFLFYYSGHARASGLSFHDGELPLSELRALLNAIAANVRIAVIDACQSGALSQVKGASPVASFTVSSTEQLQTRGTVVMASSTASELSQESEALQASIFTHHLTAGLWGAADRDGDRRVNIDEAYSYAYRQTLTSSARTRVGRQHPTFESALSGKGDLILTQPGRASSRLRIETPLRGAILIRYKTSGAVFAEVDKAAGAPMVLALPPADYEVLVASDGDAVVCDLALRRSEASTLDTASCPTRSLSSTAQKGESTRSFQGWAFELTGGAGTSVEGDFVRRLDDFGYNEQLDSFDFSGFRYAISATAIVHRYLEVGLRFQSFESKTFARELTRGDGSFVQTFEWSAYGAGAFGRARLPLRSFLIPYVQIGAGLSFATTDLDGAQETEVGYYVSALGGIQVMFFRHVGLLLEGGYVTAPTVSNLLGDRHDSGGARLFSGLRVRL